MDNVSFLNVFSGKKNHIDGRCPSCGNLFEIKNKKCIACGYNLKDFKNIILSKYVYYNNALDFIEDNDYFNALLEIKSFLTFMPNDEKGNELYVYLLYKNGRDKEYNEQLENFEGKYKFSSFIMNIENDGIEKYKIPSKINLDIEFVEDSFDKLLELYEKNRYKNINDIIELTCSFFEVIQTSKDKSKIKNKEKIINEFYNKKFLHFLSKQEMSIDFSDDKKYEKLSDDEKKKIDIKGQVEAKKPIGSIVTLTPAIYIRSNLIVREQAFVVNKTKRW